MTRKPYEKPAIEESAEFDLEFPVHDCITVLLGKGLDPRKWGRTIVELATLATTDNLLMEHKKLWP